MNHARLMAPLTVAGALVVSSANVAAAKSELTLNAEHRIVHVGDTVRFTGAVGDDAGIRRALFCLRVEVREGRWMPVGPCVAPYRAGSWSADFRTDVRFPAPGRFVFRAVGVDAGSNRGIYGPSPAVVVAVR
jgi:hypothetical protein